MTSPINLGTYTANGESFQINLIAPFTTPDGSTYYLLDANGDGTSENIAGRVVDAVLRQTLDSFFNKGADTTSTQRTLTLGSYNLSLPTVAEFTQIREQSGGLPPAGWVYVAGDGQVSTYHTADKYAADGHSIFGLTNGVRYSRGGIETDSVSRQFVAVKVEILEPTYVLQATSLTVDEGKRALFSLKTTNVADGTQVDYNITGMANADISGGNLTGQITIQNGLAQIFIDVAADKLSEGTELLTLNVGGQSASVAVNDTSSQPVYNPDNGHYYELVIARGITPSDALKAASLKSYEGLSGHLVSIQSYSENDFVWQLINSDTTRPSEHPVWVWLIGGSDREVERQWKWLDGPLKGQDLSYTNFWYDEGLRADEDYIVMSPAPISNGLWHDLGDIAYTGTGGYVVEYSIQNPTYQLAVASPTVKEGSSVNFVLQTTNIAAGSELDYSLSGISNEDIVDGLMSGKAKIGTDGKATITVKIAADKLTEGLETLTLSVADKSALVYIEDSSIAPVALTQPTYLVTSSSTKIDEGKTLVYTIKTTNVVPGSALRYEISGVDSQDIGGVSLTGDATISSTGTASVSLPINADGVTEGDEILAFNLFDQSGAIVGSTLSLVKDTSVFRAPTYQLSASKTTINEGASLTFSLTTTNVAAGTELNYKILGIQDEDISGGNLDGTIVVSSKNTATVSLSLIADGRTEGDESLTLMLVDSAGNGLVASSASVTDTSTGNSIRKVIDSGTEASLPFGLYIDTNGKYLLSDAGLAVGDSLEGGVVLKTSKGANWSPKSAFAALIQENDDTAVVITKSGTGASAAYTEQKFVVASGTASGAEGKLTLAQVLAREVTSGVDINGDDEIGDAVSSVIYDGGTAYGLYRMSSGGLSIAEGGVLDGDTPESPVSLAVAGKPWSLATGLSVAGIVPGATDGSYQIITVKGVGSKASYSSVAVGSTGTVGKTSALTLANVLGLESTHQVDLNGDDEYGDTVAEVLWDEGGSYGLYRMAASGVVIGTSGVGEGERPETSVSVMSGTKGWVLPSGTQVAGVLAGTTEGSYQIITVKGIGVKAAYSSMAVGSTGTVGKSTVLTLPQLLALESDSELDLNGDGVTGDVITSVVFDDTASGYGVYRMGSGGLVLAVSGQSQGGEAEGGVALMSGKAAWSLKGTVAAIQAHADGTVGLLIQSGTVSKPTYTDQVFTSSGLATTVKGKNVSGTAGGEALEGTAGNDTLTGGDGSDELTSGSGSDTFVYRTILESALEEMDTIVDFSVRDKLDLKGIDANQSVGKDQAFKFSTAGAANYSVWWESGESDSGTLYGDVTGDAEADFGIEISLIGLSQIEAKHIVL